MGGWPSLSPNRSMSRPRARINGQDALLGRLGDVLGRSWGRIGASWAVRGRLGGLGTYPDQPGNLLGCPEASSGRLGNLFGGLGGRRGTSPVLGPSWAVVGSS